ncbi:MAG: hypothetical protein IJ231_06895 [Clostridia bacterium]|nr:hypothetical protein [Clostridia bacterium]
MKKLISLMLALLMLALPVFSGAEEADVAAGLKQTAALNPLIRYMAQGQEVTMDVSLETSEMLFALMQMPEEIQTAVKDLLNVLSFRFTAQTQDRQAQTGTAVLLSGEPVVETKVAYGAKNLYAASNLLGDRILQVTPEQLKALGNQALSQMVASGQVTEEQVAAAKRFVKLFREDPVAALKKLVGEPDLNGVLTAAMPIVTGIRTEEVTEAPEALPEAAQVIVVPLAKDALTGLTTEIAKLIWSLPVVQYLAPNVKEGPKSEEEWIAALNRLPEALAEDTEIRVYMDESLSAMYMTADLKVNKDGETVAVGYTMLMRVGGEDMTADYVITLPEMTVKAQMAVTAQDNQVRVDYHITSEAMLNGVTFQPVEEIIAMNVEKGESRTALNADMTVRVKQDPDAAETGVTLKLADAAEDAGDHAEESGAFAIGMEGMGDLLTVRFAGRTDLAEAYIITPDAVQPLAMSAEELEAFQQEVTMNAQTALLGVLPKLPQSVLQLFMQTGN